jgi:hypothetical protein
VPAPLVVSVDPSDGSTNAALNSILVVEFSTALLPASVSDETFQLSKSSSGYPLPVDLFLFSSNTKVRITPRSELEELTSYQIDVVGTSTGLSFAVQAADGSNLATSSQTTFTTTTERYVPLSEVTKPDQYESVGPIRKEDVSTSGLGTGVSNLVISSLTPKEFTPNVDIALSTITVKFGEQVGLVSGGTPLSVAYEPILGIPRYDAIGVQEPFLDSDGTDPTGIGFRHEYTPTSEHLTNLFRDPVWTAAVTADGEGVALTRQPDLTAWYNQLAVVTVSGTDITGSTGQTMADGEDVVYTFSTQYWPLAVGVRAVRLKMGKAIRHLFDDTIHLALADRTFRAFEEMGFAGRQKNLEPIPEPVYAYALWGTICDLFDMLMAEDISDSGETVTLGDFTVQKRSGGFDAGKISLYNRAKKELDRWEYELQYERGGLSPQIGVKGDGSGVERSDYRQRLWDVRGASNLPIVESAAWRQVRAALLSDRGTAIPAKAVRADGALVMQGTVIYLENNGKRFVIDSSI